MSGFFENLAQRATDPAAQLQPRAASRFEAPAPPPENPPAAGPADATPERRRRTETSPPPASAAAAPNRAATPPNERAKRPAERAATSAVPEPLLRETIETVRVETRGAAPAPAVTTPPSAAAAQRERSPEFSPEHGPTHEPPLAADPPGPPVSRLRAASPNPETPAREAALRRPESAPTAPLLARAPASPAAVPSVGATPAAVRPAAAETRAAPTIRISIGTVEIRGAGPAPVTTPRPAPGAPRPQLPSLEEYLVARAGGKSR